MIWNRKEHCKKKEPIILVNGVDNKDGVSAASSAAAQDSDNDLIATYNNYPLVQSMIQHERVRNSEFEEEGKIQITYSQSTDGWIPTLFNVRGRALDWIVFPWTIVMIHACIYTAIQETLGDPNDRDLQTWEIFFGILLNSTLSFLLVFRLNRAAGRYWTARFYWGDIVAKGRTLCSGILCHADHDPVHRDETIRWVGGFAVAAMEFLRGIKHLEPKLFAGVLNEDQVRRLEQSPHPPLYAIDQIRLNMKEIFRVDAETPLALAHAWTQELDTLEKQLNTIMDNCGGMERIRATPLPLVYVSHLRTFLMIALFLLPYVVGPAWGWGTIPVVAATAFALLGIEAAAAEVESPFRLDRVNALNMDAYCKGFLLNVSRSNHFGR